MSFLQFLACCVLASVITSPISCTMYENRLLSEASARGQDPLRLQCAMSPNTLGRSEMCRALAAVPPK